MNFVATHRRLSLQGKTERALRRVATTDIDNLMRATDSHLTRLEKNEEVRFDYKRRLKNAGDVADLRYYITLGYQTFLDAEPAKAFGAAWTKEEGTA